MRHSISPWWSDVVINFDGISGTLYRRFSGPFYFTSFYNSATYSRRVNEMQKFLGDKNCTMTEFDNELVRRLIKSIKIISEDKMIITFKSGIEMEQTLKVREKYKGCGQWKRNKSNVKINACL